MEIGTEAAQFLFREYTNGIFGHLWPTGNESPRGLYTRGGLEDGWRQRQLGGERREQRVLLTLTVAMLALTAAMMAEGWDEAAEGLTDATRLCCSSKAWLWLPWPAHSGLYRVLAKTEEEK